MSNNTTLARPYGKAAFEYALHHRQIEQWSGMLQYATIVAHEHPSALRATPFFKGETKDVMKNLDGISAQAVSHFENFLQLVGENRRLNVLPEIAALFEHYRAEHEKRIDATVVSAFPLEKSELTKLEAALKARFGREVVLQSSIDEHLLGGAVIRVGDLVIDGSARGALTRLGEILCRN